MPDGRLCGATRRREVPRCFSHDPGSSEEAAEARRLGGLRRRRDHAVAAAFDLTGISSIEEWSRVAEIATLDALTLGNGIGRATALAALIRVGLQLYTARELEARLAALEAAHAATTPRASGLTLLADAERLADSVR